jgi:DNA replication and repair protein RecF
VIVERLELTDFRNYHQARFDLTAGTTVVLGDNGQGKTNLAEALAYVATLTSFRGVPGDVLIRVGAARAVVRAQLRDDDGREVLVECELAASGTNRVQINRQRLGRTRDLLGVLRVTVFAPDDLTLVKGGPVDRRRYMDDSLVALAVKYDALRLELDRVVKQRNTLLKQAGGRLDTEVAVTLDVWDARLSAVGEQFGKARAALIDQVAPHVIAAYDHLARGAGRVELRYDPPWRHTGLAAALAAARAADLRRAVTTVGPHRDELDLRIDGLPARTHASQGEQRTLALALRLGTHRLVAEKSGTTPVLVLDDVLSELDGRRSAALLDSLPAGQIVITSAGAVPTATAVDRVIRIAEGGILDG